MSRHLEDAFAKDYDVVIIPGGVWNPDTLRGDAKATVRSGGGGDGYATTCRDLPRP